MRCLLADSRTQTSKIERMELYQMEVWEEVGIGLKKEKYLTCSLLKSSRAQFKYDQLDKHEANFSSVTGL